MEVEVGRKVVLKKVPRDNIILRSCEYTCGQLPSSDDSDLRDSFHYNYSNCRCLLPGTDLLRSHSISSYFFHFKPNVCLDRTLM